MSHERFNHAANRASIAAIEWAEAWEAGNGTLEEQAYHDFKKALHEANTELNANLVKFFGGKS